jgi:hypothetical protein
LVLWDGVISRFREANIHIVCIAIRPFMGSESFRFRSKCRKSDKRNRSKTDWGLLGVGLPLCCGIKSSTEAPKDRDPHTDFTRRSGSPNSECHRNLRLPRHSEKIASTRQFPKSDLRSIRPRACDAWQVSTLNRGPTMARLPVARVKHYSYLSATMGSTRIARRAGM